MHVHVCGFPKKYHICMSSNFLLHTSWYSVRVCMLYLFLDVLEITISIHKAFTHGCIVLHYVEL